MIFGSDWISYDDYERAVAMENIAARPLKATCAPA
jgi:hypothetical protein